MKKVILLTTFAITFSLLAITALAGRNQIIVTGNCTTATYYNQTVSTTQLNNSFDSSYEPWFRAKINISVDSTSIGSCSVVYINFTLGDRWALNTTTKARFYNSSLSVILDAANESFVDGLYGRLGFNLTDYNIQGEHASGNNVTVTNTTNTTFYIEYRLQSFDSNKTETSSVSGREYTYNVSYSTPSDLTVENITVIYKPSNYDSMDAVKSVNFNGTIKSRGTGSGTYTLTPDGFRMNDDIDVGPGPDTWLQVKFTLPETGHGATGAGRKRPGVARGRAVGFLQAFQRMREVIINFLKWLFGMK